MLAAPSVFPLSWLLRGPLPRVSQFSVCHRSGVWAPSRLPEPAPLMLSRRGGALYRRGRVDFFAVFFGDFFAAFFGADFFAGDFFAAAFPDFFAGDFFAVFFAAFLTGDFLKAVVTVVTAAPNAVFTVPAASSAIARPYPTPSAAFSTNDLFAIFGPPCLCNCMQG